MKRAARGFTLLELILSLAMTVVIAGTLASSLYIAFRANTSAQEAVDSGRLTGIVNQVIARDIAGALPPTGILAAEFIGEITSLSFYSTGPETRSSLQSDIKRVEYALVQQSDPLLSTLVRRVQTNLLAQVEEELPEEVMCRDVSSFMLRYYDGMSWYDTWDSTTNEDTLPMAIEIAIEVSRPGAPVVTSTQIMRVPCGVRTSTQLELSAAGGAAW